MSPIDVFIGPLLLFELYRGLKRGFVAEVGSIVALVVAFYIASALRVSMAHFLSPVCYGSAPWSSVIGFLFTFLVVFLLIVILSKIFDGFLGIIALGGINRLAGGLFCLFKGVLIFSIVLNLYETIDKDHSFVGPDRVKSSVFYKPVLKVAPAMFPYFRTDQSDRQKEKSNADDSKKMIV
jgi:membrane protein required for colicin V production